MKIRDKFIGGLIFILIISVLVMNISIKNVLNSDMEKGINNSLKQVMNSTNEYIKYKLLTNSSKDKKDALIEEGNYIVKYISLNYQCKCSLTDMNSKLISQNVDEKFQNMISSSNKIAIQGKAISDLKYENKGVNAVLTYPIYADYEYIGVISIVKNFNSQYNTYKKTINIINIIEIGIFLTIFIFLLLMTDKVTKPITKLTSAVKELGNGDYDISINEHGKDEVAILTREFMYMRDKIKEQIQTIEAEKDKVYKLEKGRREFFNSVTHELKTPLTAISGYAELLLTGMVQDEEFNKRAIERIYSESERLHKLVLELIDVSKGINVVEDEFKEIDMKKLITQSCSDMNIKANKYSLKIVQNISHGIVKGQENKLRQVMINIIDNAIKYSENGNKIFVNSYIEDNSYIIEIVNRSNPIPKNIFDNIFEPFVKHSNNNSKDSRGLGLYLCKEIVKEHGGKIFMDNGQEVRIKIYLNIIK
ncbi:histidine kinase [Clostridium novyi A str. 4552]|uniref:histidine kinase n=1 Tax=Clostridium novyi A str. 4552 TaxID=1444289 RepID=A0A0A0I686_CLONO|nr:HAMP domain-containing sensor histidine kinase [Clostridium novyi]KGM96934.1 histidine kinase [Clostridium novyi A str. 4552]